MEWSPSTKALVIGCGGLGSEIIKILVGIGIEPTIIDFDCVEITNLSRQFYFTKDDNGQFKSEIIGRKKGIEYKITRVENLEIEFFNNFDVVFSCVDSIASRMEINYLFVNSKSKMLIDCGVEGTKTHIKKVFKSKISNKLESSCLYCIKDLYNTDETPHLCSLTKTDTLITPENRNKILISLIFKDAVESENSNAKYEEIVIKFNSQAPKNLKTTLFEVQGIAERIIPNACWINSICASYAVILSSIETNEDFFYYDGAFELDLHRLSIEKDPDCFVCKNL